jgi:hypothetical protein
MKEIDHGNHIDSDEVAWMPVDLFSFKRKGLTNDKISKMTGIPIHIINDHFAELDEVRNRSGIF